MVRRSNAWCLFTVHEWPMILNIFHVLIDLLYIFFHEILIQIHFKLDHLPINMIVYYCTFNSIALLYTPIFISILQYLYYYCFAANFEIMNYLHFFLPIQDFSYSRYLGFYMNFIMVLPIFHKVSWDSDVDYVEPVDQFEKYCHHKLCAIWSLLAHEHRIFNIFLKCFTEFSIYVFLFFFKIAFSVWYSFCGYYII